MGATVNQYSEQGTTAASRPASLLSEPHQVKFLKTSPINTLLPILNALFNLARSRYNSISTCSDYYGLQEIGYTDSIVKQLRRYWDSNLVRKSNFERPGTFYIMMNLLLLLCFGHWLPWNDVKTQSDALACSSPKFMTRRLPLCKDPESMEPLHWDHYFSRSINPWIVARMKIVFEVICANSLTCIMEASQMNTQFCGLSSYIDEPWLPYGVNVSIRAPYLLIMVTEQVRGL